MYAYLNISRFALYGLLGLVTYLGDIPWWIVLGLILWDNNHHILVKVPFTKTKEPKVESQKQIDDFWAHYKPSNNADGNGGVGAQ